jgi:Raf kinase inhibitor-like YbhB/YbcL family protein
MRRWFAALGFGMLAANALVGCSSATATPPQPTPIAATHGSEAVPPTMASDSGATSSSPPVESAALALRLEAFDDGGMIPDRYTCSGENGSPAVSWSGVPAGSQTLILIVYDADAGIELGAGTELGFIHWLVYDIPATTAGFPQGATRDSQALAGGIETSNDFLTAAGATFPGGGVVHGTGYDGPCPPEQHTYVFRLLALNQPLGLPDGTSPQSVLDELEGHVLGAADWTGLYPLSPQGGMPGWRLRPGGLARPTQWETPTGARPRPPAA